MKVQEIKETAFGLGIVVLQIIFIRHLNIFSMQADIVFIFLIWYMSRKTRTAAIIMAAVLGFFQDALLDLWGLNMFSKTLTVFLIYRWVADDNGHTNLPRVISFVFIGALLHNLFLLILSTAVDTYTAEVLLWRHWIGNAAYTTAVAGIIYLFRTK